jgi:phosphoglycerate dehydrogenase-like enzyme
MTAVKKPQFLVSPCNWKDDCLAEGIAILKESGEIRALDLPSFLPGDTRANGKEEDRKHLEDSLKNANAWIIGPWRKPWPIPAEWLSGNLSVISGTFDNRFDWIDLELAQAKGITVIDTSRSMTPTVAEFALAMTLNLLRDIPYGIEDIRKGGWRQTNPDLSAEFVYGNLTGRRVGLVGFGSINRRYAELLAPFRCELMVYDPFAEESSLQRANAVRVSDLVELASRSEVFVVGVPPTPATLGLIDARVIDALPKGSSLVLVTRMAVMDQSALWRRTEAGEIRAAVDVFAPEPPPADAPFRKFRHVLPTPHIAGGLLYCHRRCFADACRDAASVLQGKPPRYGVTLWDDRCYKGKLG